MLDFGELVGTFLLIFLGLGSNLWRPVSSRIFIGLRWGLAVFIGNGVGHLFGSTNLNPIFSLVALATSEVELVTFWQQLLGQIIGCSMAVLMLLMMTKDKPLVLSDFAAVASCDSPRKNLLIEVLGTISLLLSSAVLTHYVSQVYLRMMLVSLVISGLISLISPITGASFNPVRDLIPRTIFSYGASRGNQIKKYETTSIISSNFGPLLAAVIFIVLDLIFKREGMSWQN